MANQTVPDEVIVLRFFESGPVEKVEAVFNIVCDKMRDRLPGHNAQSQNSPAATPVRQRRKRGPKSTSESQAVDETRQPVINAI